MKHKFFIFYSNSTFETVSKLNDTLIRLIESGVISYIYDIEKNELKAKTEKGIQDLKVPLIN